MSDGEHALVLVDLLDRRFVGHREQHHVAAFLGLANRPHRDAIGGFVERLVVALDVFRVGQLARRARHAAEELQRRRNRVGRRKVIDELGADPRVLRVSLIFAVYSSSSFWLGGLWTRLRDGPQARRRHEQQQHDKREAGQRDFAGAAGLIHPPRKTCKKTRVIAHLARAR